MRRPFFARLTPRRTVCGGGVISTTGGSLHAFDCPFVSNAAVGGYVDPYDGGHAIGGGISLSGDGGAASGVASHTSGLSFTTGS